jgi:pimeloyl-ACP methyl ester carboxylesterase
MSDWLIRTAAAVAFAAAANAGGCSADPGFQPTFTAEPCPDRVTAVMLETPSCGYLTVLQSRDRPGGARIRLFVARIEPPGEASPDPMLVVGETLGNGIEHGSLAPMAARTHRPILLLDQRGTGLSEPNLTCPEVRARTATLLGLRQSDPAANTAFLEAVRECRSRLTSDGVDLSAYNLTESAADVADLRRALSIDQINLIGTGTAARIAVETLRRHPEGIRTAVLDSPDLPGFDDLTHAVARTEDALATVGRACAKAGTCGDAGPDLVASLRQAVVRLDRKPITITVDQPAGGRPTSLILDGALLLRTVRHLMTSSGGRDLPEVPMLIAQALSGTSFQLSSLTQTRILSDEGMCIGYVPLCEGRFTHGLYYSIVCRDLVPFAAPAASPTVGETDGYQAAYGRHPYRELCPVWDVGRADPEIATPVASDIPVLIEVGAYDPYTRLDEVRRATGRLTNVYVVEVPNHSYNVFGFYECPRNIRRAWLDNPGMAPTDTTCLTTEIHDPFA